MRVDCDVLVIGAGISGLTAAFRLAGRGCNVQVIDSAPRAGGVIGSERRDGVLIERGPNSMLDTTPLVKTLLADLGIESKRIEVAGAARRRYIVRSGKLIALPTSPSALLRSRLFSAHAKVRLLCEAFVAAARDDVDESVSAFVKRRLGAELLDYAVEPFVAGIYAGNPDELSLRSAFPRLHALERQYGSLIKGQMQGGSERAASGEKSRHVARSFSFRDGLQTLTDALAHKVPFRLSAGAVAIARAAEDTISVTLNDGSEQHARAVVLATPARAAAALLANIDDDAARALDEIPYAPVASVVQAYRNAQVKHRLDGFGFLVPRVEKRAILGTLFSTTMFEGRAPQDIVSLTTYIGGRRNPELAANSEEEVSRIAAAETAALLGIEGEPESSVVTQWREAIPQYTLGHAQRIERAARAELALPGLFLCSSYRGGVSVADCIKSAHGVADTVAAHLAAPAR